MTRITNADHVLLLLRAHLERTQKQRRKRKGAEASEQGAAAHASALQRVGRLASADGLSERELRRALISGLLAEEFGAEVLNDPSFVQVVDDVVKIIERDAEASALLGRAFEQVMTKGG